MENKEEKFEKTEDTSVDLKDFKKSERSKKKSMAQKAATLTLAGTLLASTAGGCSTNKGSEEKSSPPIDPDPIEEVLDSKEEDFLENDEIRIEKQNVFSPLVETNDHFQINLPSNIPEFENKDLKYSVFESREGGYYLEEVRNFVNALVDEQIDEKNPLPAFPKYTRWDFDGGSIAYSTAPKHFVEISSEKPFSLPNVQINPESKESVQEALVKMTSEFFTGDFEYRVDEISKEGEYYKVNYSRLLEGVPIYETDYPLYLVFSQDGKLKEGRIWLKEFEKKGEVSLLPKDKLAENIHSKEYPKSVAFRVPSVIETGAETDFYPHHRQFTLPGDKQSGVINVEEGELVYYYRFFKEESVLPMLRLKGEGFVNPEVMFIGDTETRKAKFEVLANAMSSEYVEGYPAK